MGDIVILYFNIINNKYGLILFMFFLLFSFVGLICLNIIKYRKFNKIDKADDSNELVDSKDSIDSDNLTDNEKKEINIINEILDDENIEYSDETIKIPIEDIHKRIEELSKIGNDKKDNKNLEDTVVLFSTDDIKEIIKKDLDKVENNKKKQSVDKSLKKTDKNSKNELKSSNKTKK